MVADINIQNIPLALFKSNLDFESPSIVILYGEWCSVELSDNVVSKEIDRSSLLFFSLGSARGFWIIVFAFFTSNWLSSISLLVLLSPLRFS